MSPKSLSRVSPTTALRTMQLLSHTRAIQTRQFTIVQRVRHAVRGFEPSPFERYPMTIKQAKPDWARQFRKIGDAALFFFPGFALVLGWPLIAEKVLDGRM